MPAKNKKDAAVTAKEPQTKAQEDVLHDILAAPKMELASADWVYAKEQQHATLPLQASSNYKISRKKANARHSLISLLSEKDRELKLFQLAGQGQYLGKGGFGKVKLGVDEYGNYVAVKIQENIVKAGGEPRIPTATTTDKEIATEMQLGRFYGSFSTVSETRKTMQGQQLSHEEKIEKKYQVVDYLGISLEQILNGKEDPPIQPIKLTKEQRYQVALGILQAVAELHAKGIIHCDIHPGNVLIKEENGRLKVNIIDFGLAKQLRPGETEVLRPKGEKVNMGITPPEIVRYDGEKGKWVLGAHPYYSAQTDIYSIGLLLMNNLKLEEVFLLDMIDADPQKRPIIATIQKKLSKVPIHQAASNKEKSKETLTFSPKSPNPYAQSSSTPTIYIAPSEADKILRSGVKISFKNAADEYANPTKPKNN